MSIPFELTLLLLPFAGVVAIAAKRSYHAWLVEALSLKSRGDLYAAERQLRRLSKPVPVLGLSLAQSDVLDANVQLAWVWLELLKCEYVQKSIPRLRTATENKPELLQYQLQTAELDVWLQFRLGSRKESAVVLDQAIGVCQNQPEQLQRSLVRASLLYDRGLLHMLDDNLPLAASFLRQSQSALMYAVGAESVHHVPVLMTMAWIEVLQGDMAEGNRMLAHVLRTYGPVLGKWNPRTAHVISLLGAVAALENDWETAAEYLEVSAKIMRAHGLMQTIHAQRVETALEFVARVQAHV